MKETKEVLIYDELVYLRKDILGWHVTYPIKINGKINWKNLITGGNWFKLILIIFFVIVMILAIFEYVESLRYCADFIANNTDIVVNPSFNLTF